jgi:mono/diheme cytochrome c family protein
MAVKRATLVVATLVVAAVSLSFSPPAWAQAPSSPPASRVGPSGLGRPATKGEVQAVDIAISGDGKELPPGSGTAAQGASIYTQRACSTCHGPAGKEGPAPVLIPAASVSAPMGGGAAPGGDMGMGGGGNGMVTADPNKPLNHASERPSIRDWPFAPTIWDFIHRAMPYQTPGRLSADDTYSLVAYLLFKNGIIQEEDVMDAKSLPKVQMPRRSEYKSPPAWKPGDPLHFQYKIDKSVLASGK